jgi:tetratricopeptide (TPR) repeat protein
MRPPIHPLILAALLSAALPALADTAPNAEAAARFERGTRLFNLQEWPEAIQEYKAAYKLDPRLEYLFALSQAQRLSGDCEGAIRGYNAVLRSNPSEKQAAAATELIAACQAKLAAAPPAPPPPAAPPTAPLAAPPAEAPAPRRWYDDGAGHGLFWSGAAGVVAGGVLLAVGNGKMSSANGASDYAGFVSGRDGARPLQLAGATALAVGSALAAAGVVRFALASERRPVDRVALEVRGLGATAVVRFR